jgi:choline-phosphate cytidylyltransferase
VSWLKKNEMDMKRHVQDIRENIRTNWTTTGQELGKELRLFWPASRPQSPARYGRYDEGQNLAPGMSANANSNDFIAGYAVGLIGGVRSWVGRPDARRVRRGLGLTSVSR